MNDSTAHLTKTLEDLKQQLSAKLAEARKILAVINTIEEMLNLPRTAPGELTAGVSVQDTVSLSDFVSVGVTSPKPTANSIRPDEYLGEPPLEAAKKFLRRVRRAVQIDEIAEAIRRGGAATTGANWKEQLEASLLRSTRDVVKVQDGIFGLTEFYSEEQLKGLRQTRRQRPKNEGKKPRRRRLKKKTGDGRIKATEQDSVPSESTDPGPARKKRGRPPRRHDQEPNADQEKNG